MLIPYSDTSFLCVCEAKPVNLAFVNCLVLYSLCFYGMGMLSRKRIRYLEYELLGFGPWLMCTPHGWKQQLLFGYSVLHSGQ